MSDIRVELFWRKRWVEALVMLPFFLLVALFSSQFIDGWWLLSALLGIFLGSRFIGILCSQKPASSAASPKPSWQRGCLVSNLFLLLSWG